MSMSDIGTLLSLVEQSQRFCAERNVEIRAAMDANEHLTIVKHPDPVLKQVCAEVTEFDSALSELAAGMLRTIGPIPDLTYTGSYPRNLRERIGVGLASSQVGVPIRMVVIAAHGFPEFAMVNPVIERTKGWEKAHESCLSLPEHKGGDIYRATTVWVRFQNLHGTPQTLRAKDYLARVIQHETDHCDGIEFTDRMAQQEENHGR